MEGKGKSETRYCYDCGEQGHIGVNCPYKWANNMDEEDDQVSSWEGEPEGEKAEELANLETPDDEGEWSWTKRKRITRWSRRVDPRPAFHCLTEDEKVSKHLDDRITWPHEMLEELSGRGRRSPWLLTREQQRM